MVNRYYLIEMPVPQQTTESVEGPMLDASCEVTAVKVAPAYERNQIVNRSGSHEISYYKYHMWAVRPSVAVREVILRNLETAGVFRSVSDRFSLSIPDYQLLTRIKHLEVRENKNRFSAHLALEITLVGNESREVILAHQADRVTPLDDKDLNLFAGEISRMLGDELRAFRLKLADQLVQTEN